MRSEGIWARVAMATLDISTYARVNPFSYALFAGLVASTSVFIAAGFAELTSNSALVLMTACGVVAGAAALGAVGPLRRGESYAATNLQQVRIHMSSLLAAIGDGVLLFDVDDRLVMVNGRFREMFPEIAQRLANGLDVLDLAKIVAAYGGRTEDGLTGSEFVGDVSRFLQQGEGERLFRIRGSLWLRVTVRRMDDGGLLLVVSDLTEIVRHELKLKETEERFERLAERLPGAVFQRREQAGLSFIVQRPSQDFRILVDRLRVRQILLNLLSNAIKFNRPGGEVRLIATIGANSVELLVIDTGIGMTPAEAEIAFQPFGQVGANLACQREGTGLGLPLARMLAAHHDGSLRLESKPGVGTRAIFTLPSYRVDCGADRAKRA